MKKILAIILVMFTVLSVGAERTVKDEGSALAEVLEKCLQKEEVTPDSIYYFLENPPSAFVEDRETARWLIYHAALAKLFAERSDLAQTYSRETKSHPDSMREWSREEWYEKSTQMFREVLSHKDILHSEQASNWQPVVNLSYTPTQGGEKSCDMLSVVWRSMCCSLPRSYYQNDSVLSARSVIDFYIRNGCLEDALALEMEEPQEDVYDVSASDGMIEKQLKGKYDSLAVVFKDRSLRKSAPYENLIATIVNDSLEKRSPTLEMTLPAVAYPGDSLKMELVTRNENTVHMLLYRLPKVLKKDNIEDDVFLKKLKKDGILQAESTWTIPETRADSTRHDTLSFFRVGEPGRYAIVFNGQTDARLNKKAKESFVTFTSTRLFPVSQTLPEGKLRVTFVDAKTGVAVNGVKVTVSYSSNGYKVQKEEDEVFQKTTEGQGVAEFEKRNLKQALVSVSTEDDEDCPTFNILSWYTYNQNDKDVEVINLYTDRSIYRPGQEVKVAGIVYDRKHWNAGVKTDAEYTIQLIGTNGKEIASQEVKTDSMGTFSTSFTLPEDIQLGSYRLRAGSKYVYFRVEEYKRPTFYVELTTPQPPTEGDSAKVIVTGTARNYDGTPLAFARVTGKTMRMAYWWQRKYNRYYGKETLDTLYTDAQGHFSYTIVPPKEKCGVLHIEVSVLSSQGETQKAETSVRISPDPPQPQEKREWMECTRDTFSMDENAIVKVLATGAPIHILAFACNNTVMDKEMDIQDSLVMEIPYKEEYDDGVTLYVWYVKDGKIHFKTQYLYKRLPEANIHLHWETFRDHTQPGGIQHWTLVGEPRMNLMLTLYDSSLDAIAQHGWNLNVSRQYDHPSSTAGYPHSGNRYASQWFDSWRQDLQELTFSMFDEKYFATRYEAVMDRIPMLTAMPSGVRYLKTTAVANRKAVFDSTPANTELVGSIGGLNSTSTDSSADDDGEIMDVTSLRQDFSETGVFLSQLRADATGRVAVSFTIPESLTTWHLLGLAHTPDMKTGMIDEKIIAQKNLMAELSLPRFVRRRDKMTFGVNVKSTQNPLGGTVTVEIVSATDAKRVLKRESRKFTLAEGRDTTYILSFDVPEDEEGLSFRVLAKSGEDSDGELREIPVLTDLVTLTDSRALTLSAGETQKVDINALFPEGSTDRSIIVEKTTNPVATAIDALKPLLTPRCNDALSWTSAYYASTLLGKVDRMPYIHKVAQMQNGDGSLSWFPGMYGSEYITREVALQLLHLPIVGDEAQTIAEHILEGSRRYLLECMQKRLLWREKNDVKWCATLEDLQAVYVFQRGISSYPEAKDISRKILDHLPQDIVAQGNEYMALVALLTGDSTPLETLRKRLTHSDGYYIAYPGGNKSSIDRRLHIHTQIMEAFSSARVQDADAILRGMRLWLLNEKRTQGWKNSVNCTNAVWALSGFSLDNIQKADREGAGFSRDTISDLRSPIAISNTKAHTVGTEGIMWAGVYATYTLPMESVEKKGTDMLIDVDWVNNTGMKVGDHATSRIVLTLKRDYEYVHVSVPRAAKMESEAKLSGCGWKDGMVFYREVYDTHTDYFFPSLPAGTYVLEDGFIIDRTGSYSTGIPTIECQYAEEFRGHGKQSVL